MTRALAYALVVLLPVTAFAQPADEPPPAAPETGSAVPPPEVVAPAPAPIPAAETPVAPAAAAPDVDLSGLDLGQTPEDDHLTLYGFADVGWRTLLNARTDVAANYFPKENTFLVGHLDLYATKKLSKRWRTMFEVRFMYAPYIKQADGTYASNDAPDPADLERPEQQGGIDIERIYLEYEINEWLTIRAGSFLTPYGVWNVDHGSPTIIPVDRPYIIGEGLFPERQTGLELYGSHPYGDYQLKYHLTLTNGRGPFDTTRDLDENKALGARVEVVTPWLDGVTLGISGYRGRYTDRPADVITVDASGALVNSTPPGVAYDEIAWGADAVIHRGPLHLQFELIGNDRTYLEGQREKARGGFVVDGLYVGAYALAGYRFDRWWQMMPFAVLEVDRTRSIADLGDDPMVTNTSVGLNFRPAPSVTLKWEIIQAHVSSTVITTNVRATSMQAAWAF